MKTIIKITLFFIVAFTYVYPKENIKTVITPHLHIQLNPYKNIIYSASFHHAWKNLQNYILHDNVKTEQNIKLVTMLNRNNPANIDAADHLSICGFAGNGICRQIFISMQNKFNTHVNLSEYNDDPYNIICYSYFRKLLEFEAKFETVEQPLPFFYNGKSSDIKYFGIWTAGNSMRHMGIRKQVKILYHHDENNFIISISNEHDIDELLLIMCSEFNGNMTINTAIKQSIDKINLSHEEELVDNDRLLIPKVEFNLTREYNELYGVHLANKEFKDYFFGTAIHNIGFKLNESGTFADSEARLILKKGPAPRTMIINKPFLLLMKEKTSRIPYFAAWIVNPELLVQTDII